MRTLFVASCVLVVVCHCGGKADSTSPPDDASSEGGGDASIACLGSGHGPPASRPSDSRPSAPTCPRSPGPGGLPPDAAPPASCNTDADCTASNGGHCAEHLCGYDQCLVDADCPSNQVCVCNDMAGGSWRYGSECVPADCRTDADCGAGNYCIPSRGYCGQIGGYNCTSSHDTCVDPATDCAACRGNACVYSPIVGHFACATTSCSG